MQDICAKNVCRSAINAGVSVGFRKVSHHRSTQGQDRGGVLLCGAAVLSSVQKCLVSKNTPKCTRHKSHSCYFFKKRNPQAAGRGGPGWHPPTGCGGRESSGASPQFVWCHRLSVLVTRRWRYIGCGLGRGGGGCGFDWRSVSHAESDRASPCCAWDETVQTLLCPLSSDVPAQLLYCKNGSSAQEAVGTCVCGECVLVRVFVCVWVCYKCWPGSDKQGSPFDRSDCKQELLLFSVYVVEHNTYGGSHLRPVCCLASKQMGFLLISTETMAVCVIFLLLSIFILSFCFFFFPRVLIFQLLWGNQGVDHTETQEETGHTK